MTRQRLRTTRANELPASADEEAPPTAADTPPGTSEGVPSSTPPRPTKLALLQQRLRAPGGATLPALLEATGWQAHTLRAALTRMRHAGHAVERGRTSKGVTTYRIVVETEAEAGPLAPSIASEGSLPPQQGAEGTPDATSASVTTAPASAVPASNDSAPS